MDFLTHFASDRTHMKDENTGAWIKPPPDYAPIKTNSSTNNIEDYISMDPMKGKGAIKDLNGFLKM